MPDFGRMTLDELEEYYEEIENKYNEFRHNKLDDEESEEYAAWEDKFEFLEERKG